MAFLKESEEDYRPILTPLIDVVFLLIIFFLVSTEFIQLTHQVRIELPQSTSGESSEKIFKSVIELNAQGKIYFNGSMVPLDELGNSLKGIDPSRPIQLRADKQAPYGQVIEILDLLQLMGFKEIDAALLKPKP